MSEPCRDEWLFAPQVTVISGIPTPSTTPPVFSHQSTLVLTYPYVSPTTTVTLRSPKLGDSQTVTVEASRQTTLGNALRIGRNPIWPIIDIFNFTFEGLTDEVIEEYFVFSALTAGKMIGLRDHRNRQYYGFILNPDGASSSEQVCSKDLEISFRGYLA